MQRYDAVLFDVDGTWIHSRPGIFNCFAYAFRKMGLDPDAIDCSRYLGPPLRWSFAQHFATDAEVEQAVEYYRVHYEEVGSHQCSLFPGVRQMMDTLKGAGLYMATATCKPVEVVTPILKEQGLFDYFDRIGGASMDESVDNKTDVIRLVLQDPRLAGKRILMERITPLWSRMSFSQKTTARNLFRYKKRFFMTVLGVAGCTALLLIGFGIQDSLLPIVTKQSTELTHNDMSITLSDPKALTMEQGLAEELDGNSAVQNWGAVYTKSTTIYNAEGESASVSIVAAAKDSDLTRYVTFRTRKGHKAISFDSGSAILTEKTAENLGLHTGDTFWVENAEGTRVKLTLTGITENYMFTRLYLPRAQLESLLGTEDIPWNTVYGQTSCTDAAGYNALRTDLLDCNYVSGISFTEDTTELFDNLIVSLGYVVVLIIICAAALAAVVLYNLISVNLGERKKELATIKVLGFYDQEVYRYIFREIELLALIGSGVGLALGVPLHKFIVLTVEMDQLMFIRTIAPRSYLLAVALTMVFTVVVCFVMRRHVRRISMVESMKAPE